MKKFKRGTKVVLLKGVKESIGSAYDKCNEKICFSYLKMKKGAIGTIEEVDIGCDSHFVEFKVKHNFSVILRVHKKYLAPLDEKIESVEASSKKSQTCTSNKNCYIPGPDSYEP